jgi:hypothetical protein
MGLTVATAAIIGTLLFGSAASSTSSFREPGWPGAPGTFPQSTPSPTSSFSEIPRREQGGATAEAEPALGEADGALPTGATMFDNEYPGVTNLDSELLQALRDAATEASDDGIQLYVNSGWRSSRYQDQLFREAVSEYGSAQEAAQWVATADTSPHVFGDAVDIGPVDATAWLAKHGARYGLCQIYRNEPWHYELRPEAKDRHCPRMYDNPTLDPRMQQ